MPNHGTNGGVVWELLEDIYRQQLARIKITEMQAEGIMSPTNYYQLKAEGMLPRYDVACYLALCFFAKFLERDPSTDPPAAMKYRKWKSWDVMMELTQAFAIAFSKRCGNNHYPISPTVKISQKFKQSTPAKLERTLIEHDMAGDKKSGLILQHAVAQSIKFGGR